jgi:glutamate synthase domain-containing protein 2
MQQAGHEWIGHSLSPTKIASHDFRVIVGADRAQPYSMSVFNVSAMSFGALSANAIRALNQGAKGRLRPRYRRGSVSPYHREFGGDLVWQIASGYFGCRNADGSFNEEKFTAQAQSPQVKMIE